jgi:hypothetical protein
MSISSTNSAYSRLSGMAIFAFGVLLGLLLFVPALGCGHFLEAYGFVFLLTLVGLTAKKRLRWQTRGSSSSEQGCAT